MAKDMFISALTASLIRVLVTVWQALVVVTWKKPGNLAGITMCLPVCYFQHVNMNKHSSGLGDYWSRRFSCTTFFSKGDMEIAWAVLCHFTFMHQFKVARSFYLFSIKLLGTFPKHYQHSRGNIFL